MKQIILLILVTSTVFGQQFEDKKKAQSESNAVTNMRFETASANDEEILFETYNSLLRNPWTNSIEAIQIVKDMLNGDMISIKGFESEALQGRMTEHHVSSLMNVIAENILKFNLDYRIVKHENESYYKLQQTHLGIDVFGAEMNINVKPSGEIVCNGRFKSIPNDLSDASISEDLAKSNIIDHLQKETTYKTFEETELEHYDQQFEIEFILYFAKDVWQKTYHFTVRPNFVERWEYFVSAATGEILRFYNNTCHVGPVVGSGQDLNNVQRDVYCFESGGTHYLFDASKDMYTGSNNSIPLEGQGIIVTLDFQNNSMQNPSYSEITNGSPNWNNKNAVSAHYNSGLCYDYYVDTHSRNSINGQGGDIVSFINVADDDGSGLDNAFWNGQYMFYGSGNAAFSPLAGSLDVAGHEMTHGVVQNEANLEYQGESGALNESFADIFGAMIDRDNWQLGEDIVNPQFFPSGALRDMSNPHNGSSQGSNTWQPEHYNERYTGNQDNGGVHINSGIPNFAFFKLATSIGKDKAEQIYYRALQQYLSKSSQFIDARIAVIEAAEDLYGTTEVQAAQIAWSQVGIGAGPGTNNDDVILNENEGEEFILSMDVNNSDQNSLYLSSTEGNNFQPVSQQTINRKPSVTDNGERCYFVNGENNIYYIDFTNVNYPNTPVSNDEFWDAVAVSKDGSKLAAISIDIDTAIYVFRLDTGDGVKFPLYNPTFTENINAGGVLYADAIEWDYTGENVVYDAYNELPNNSGDNVEYWDVGIIQVWDNATNDFADGKIEKVFTNLPEGVSIGNPTFSKNSPNIIAFDYIEESFFGEANYVLGANIENGDVGEIFENNTIASPSYSIDDTQLIFTTETLFGDKQIWIVPMADNKIEAAGNAEGLIDVADWGIWFAQGERDLLSVLELSDIGVSLFPNPNEGIVYISSDDGSSFTVSVTDIQGKLVTYNQETNLTTLQIEQPGMYIVSIQTDKGVVNEKVIVK